MRSHSLPADETRVYKWQVYTIMQGINNCNNMKDLIMCVTVCSVSVDLMGIQAAFTSPLGWHTAEWHRLTGVIFRQSRAFACSTCAMKWNGIPALECSINNALNCVMLSWLIPQSICIGNLTRLSRATGLTGYSRAHPNTWLVRSIK